MKVLTTLIYLFMYFSLARPNTLQGIESIKDRAQSATPSLIDFHSGGDL